MDRVPVWFMRQAGRSLPEYRAIKKTHTILEVCRHPDLAFEVTMQPVRRLGVDAAILFSDIVVPLQGMGVDLDIVAGVGPVFASPIRSRADVDALGPLDPETGVPYVLETVRMLASELRVPLIGFAGAPFTLACYLIEGGPSKDHATTKALMYSDPATWESLMDRLTEAVIGYLRAQVQAGAAAVQLFDSWIGALDEADYRRYAMPWVSRIMAGLEDLGVPRIIFGVATGELLEVLSETGAEVVGVDWRVPLDLARKRVGDGVCLQGNLDPAACLAPWEVLRAKTEEVLAKGGGGKSHIFNLGHGVLPQTDPAALERVVEIVHGWPVG